MEDDSTPVKPPDDRALIESLFRAIPVGIGLVRDRILERVNARVCEMVGYEPAELIGQSSRILYPTDEDFRYVGDEKYRQIRECGTGTVETRWRCKDGTIIDVLLSSTPLELGNLDAGVTFSALDITARNRAAEALEETLARYRDLVELGPDAIVILQGGGYRFINSSFTNMFGYTQDDVDAGLAFMALVQEKDHGGVTDRYRRRLAGEDVPATYLLDLVAKDGHIVPCETSATRIMFEGKPADLVLMRDVTERVEQEAARRRWEAQMLQAQKLESLGVLAGGIAHDFNNLLVAMLGNSSLALADLEPQSRAAECIRDVEAAAVRAAELVRQLLAYAGKGPFTVEKVHLRSIVEEMTHLLETSISKKATLRLVYDAGVPPVLADATQLRQVAMNLITNASEALGNESGTITVEVRCETCEEGCSEGVSGNHALPAGTCACLEVSDTGCGMDEATRARIFDPFFTTKFAGRGLGLAAALGIVRRHGGVIRVKSTPGEGTRVEVLFPTSAETESQSETDSRPPTSFRGTGTVLVVDDEPSVRTLSERALRQLGFEVALASNGREAIEVFRADPRRFAAVLLDFSMPEMGGDETLAKLREHRSDVPVLLSSGYGEQELADRIPQRSRVAFIQKPFPLPTLAKKLRKLLA